MLSSQHSLPGALNGTPIQGAISRAVSEYRDALRPLITHRERETLRDVLCAAIAHDYLLECDLLGPEEALAA
jgi:hypothetical protein